MIAYSLQLLLCYGIIGLVMGWMLGVSPFWGLSKKWHVAAFLFFLIVWLPVSMFALMAAPLVNALRIREENEIKNVGS
ncbi:hypothetical protein EWI07_11950 [Sporolactobacillus sp. THM7-4]|nr:hypothetical protein EWI07_11950 [Sporolactobacillus sp. THM7-4]